jgi:hypothetical protein
LGPTTVKFDIEKRAYYIPTGIYLPRRDYVGNWLTPYWLVDGDIELFRRLAAPGTVRSRPRVQLFYLKRRHRLTELLQTTLPLPKSQTGLRSP